MNKENGTFIDVNFIQQFFMNIIVRDDRCWHNTLNISIILVFTTRNKITINKSRY